MVTPYRQIHELNNGATMPPTIDPTTRNTLFTTVPTVFPNAYIIDNFEGELVIYTGLRSVGGPDTPLVPLEKEEAND